MKPSQNASKYPCNVRCTNVLFQYSYQMPSEMPRNPSLIAIISIAVLKPQKSYLPSFPPLIRNVNRRRSNSNRQPDTQLLHHGRPGRRIRHHHGGAEVQAVAQQRGHLAARQQPAQEARPWVEDVAVDADHRAGVEDVRERVLVDGAGRDGRLQVVGRRRERRERWEQREVQVAAVRAFGAWRRR